jgi:hypothetical protein
MINRVQFLSFLLLALTASIVHAGPVRCPGSITPVRYHPLLSQMSVFVTVNHSGPYEFIVDTGAQVTVVDPALAAQLHLPPRGTIGVLSVSRRTEQQWVSLEVIEAGPYAVHNPVAIVESLKQIQARESKVRGILGENFLAHFDLLIDYEHKILCFDGSRQMQQQLQGEHLPMVARSDDNGRVDVPQSVRISVRLCAGASKERILKLDSGAAVGILYDRRQACGPDIRGADAFRHDAAGEDAQYFRPLPPQDIRIGKHRLSEVTFVAPLSSRLDTLSAGEDGALPTRLFDRVFISFSDDYVVLNPRS